MKDDKNESKSRKTKESEPLTDKEEVKRLVDALTGCITN